MQIIIAKIPWQAWARATKVWKVKIHKWLLSLQQINLQKLIVMQYLQQH